MTGTMIILIGAGFMVVGVLAIFKDSKEAMKELQRDGAGKVSTV